MLRSGKQHIDRRAFDDLAGIHDRDFVAHLGDDAKIVSDENDSRAGRSLQVAHQIEICAWMVTSSAVVGSSAIKSFGLQASASAIIARCRMPPDSRCG